MRKLALAVMFASIVGFILVSVLVGLPAAAKANLIQNGSFAVGGSPSLADWTKLVSGSGSVTAVGQPTPALSGGGPAAALFEGPSATLNLYQNVSDTAGVQYQVNFWVLDQATGTKGTMLAGGNTIYFGSSDPYYNVWHEYTYNFTGSGSDTVLFAVGDTGTSGKVYLDMVGTDPVPEPATILLVGVGLLGLAILGRKLHS